MKPYRISSKSPYGYPRRHFKGGISYLWKQRGKAKHICLKCVICDKKINHPRVGSKTCSKKCLNKFGSIICRIREETNPNFKALRRQRNREWYAKRKEKK